MTLEILFWGLFFLCWGSFLNVVAYRIINEPHNIWGRSHCIHCHKILLWYDLIPVFSFLFCGGKCRYCGQHISLLYPIIEIFTAITFLFLLCTLPFFYFVQYAFYFSLLIISIRTDITQMLLSSFVTLYTIPIAFFLSFFRYLPITFVDSFFGALSGYLCLWSIGRLFYWWTGKQGIGEGDFELLALIGAWTGMLGCWFAVTLGSVIGVIIGIAVQAYKKTVNDVKIPFAPCLAVGSMLFVFFSRQILFYLM